MDSVPIPVMECSTSASTEGSQFMTTDAESSTIDFSCLDSDLKRNCFSEDVNKQLERDIEESKKLFDRLLTVNQISYLHSGIAQVNSAEYKGNMRDSKAFSQFCRDISVAVDSVYKDLCGDQTKKALLCTKNKSRLMKLQVTDYLFGSADDMKSFFDEGKYSIGKQQAALALLLSINRLYQSPLLLFESKIDSDVCTLLDPFLERSVKLQKLIILNDNIDFSYPHAESCVGFIKSKSQETNEDEIHTVHLPLDLFED